MVRLAFLAPVALLAACQTTTQQPAKILYPVENCGWVNVPIYGVLDRPASGGEIAGGAVVGGVIGNVVGDGDAVGTIAGAIIGGALSNTRKQDKVIVGYEQEWQCHTMYQ